MSSNDIITIKIDKKNLKKCKKSQEDKQTKKIIQNKNLDCQMDIRETNSDYEMEKKIIFRYSLFKKMFYDNYNSLRLFLHKD